LAIDLAARVTSVYANVLQQHRHQHRSGTRTGNVRADNSTCDKPFNASARVCKMLNQGNDVIALQGLNVPQAAKCVSGRTAKADVCESSIGHRQQTTACQPAATIRPARCARWAVLSQILFHQLGQHELRLV
jgi:hypothetical protein